MKSEKINIDDPVIYIPKFLLLGPRGKMTKIENLGRVTSKNDTYIFVRYRGNEISHATRPDDLFCIKGRPDLIELLDNPDMTLDEQKLSELEKAVGLNE